MARSSIPDASQSDSPSPLAVVQRAVEQIRQRHGHLGEQLEDALVRILEHPDDTPDGDRQVFAELRVLIRRLDEGLV